MRYILCFIYGLDLFLRRGTGLGSAVDKLRHQDLLCLGFAGVHQPHPLHGIAGFQFLGGSLSFASWGIICSSLLWAVSSISMRCWYSFSLSNIWL